MSVQLLSIRLPDAESDRARRNHEQAIRELQLAPRPRVIEDIVLADGVVTPVPHGLGRPVVWARESCVRGAASSGRVEEVRDGSFDRSKFVALKATGFGATVTCSLAVL